MKRESILLAQRTRKLRNVNGLTVKGLAKAASISPRTVNRVEAADSIEYSPSLHTVAQLSKAFKLSVGDLANIYKA